MHVRSPDLRALVASGGVATDLYNYFQDGIFPALSEQLKPGTTEPVNLSYVEQIRKKLPYIKDLGTTLRGANQVPQLTFFSSHDDVEGEGNDLCDAILEAVLSDVDNTVDAIMHAVKWSDASIIEKQINLSKAIDSKGVTRAFQAALSAGTHVDSAIEVVQ